jgi:hypothetical protein
MMDTTADRTAGDSSYTQMQNSAYFKSVAGRNKYGWYPVDCTSSRPVLCEVPKYNFTCPVGCARNQL